jgi:membrane-bound serine protease (ClpP class)
MLQTMFHRSAGNLRWLRDMLRAVVLAALGSCMLLAGQAVAQSAAPVVWLLQIDGPIGPASADYFTSHLQQAERAKAVLFVLELDTPGGLDHAMRDMIKAILASKVPVATYVSPSGSRAASAGTYLMYASHFAAMAPATNIGSSTPVSMGGGSPFPMPGRTQPEPAEQEASRSPRAEPAQPGASQTSGSDKPSVDGDAREMQRAATPLPGTAMDRKVLNDAVAYIRGLAELRGRNRQWAEKTVREAANLTASDALAQDVIDIIAPDLDDLLRQVNGRQVRVDGKTVTLDLKGATIERVTPGWRYEVLSLITDPNVAYILLLIGIYGLILEFYSPGTGVPGVVGVICLLLAAYALQMLPVNYTGLALLLVGIGLMVAEAFAPGFGVFGIGGAIAFIIGSMMLMQTDLPAYQVSVPIIAAFAVASVAVFVFVIGAAVKVRGTKIVSGRESIIGDSAEVMEDFTEHGLVRLHGEIWQGRSKVPLTKGAIVRIVDMGGLVLAVEPQEKN